jgi:hypothetical protein
MTPEGKVKKAVKEYLQSIGAWYYMPVTNGMGRVGCPDILVCYRVCSWLSRQRLRARSRT